MFSRWWPRLTVVWPKPTLLTRSLVLIIPAENLGHHSLPPLNKISSRDSSTRLEQHFLMRQRLQSGRYTRSYFETARIHKGQKIHDALLTASTQFMREWAWMCTWKTKRRQTLPTMQRYIAASVQRRDSNISTNWGIVGDGAGFFSWSPSTSSGGCWRRRLNSLLGEWAKQQRGWASGGLSKASRRGKQERRYWQIRKQARLGNGNTAGGFPFYTSTETQWSSQPSEVRTSGAIWRLPHGAR
jgi:hypothetical protein